jgi:hypothetical protein
MQLGGLGGRRGRAGSEGREAGLRWRGMRAGDCAGHVGSAVEEVGGGDGVAAGVSGLLAVSSGFGDQVDVVPAWRVDGG